MSYNPNNPNGQATMANSNPVVIASDQSAVPVSAASLPLPTGASTSALQTTGNTSVSSLDTKTPALGQALAASSSPVVLTAAQITTLTPLSTVTTVPPANASTNVAQINGITPLMGTGIMGTGSPRVTIASDNDPVTVKQATAANLNATVVGTGTFAVQATPVTQVDTFMLGGVNVKEINAVAPLMGNGVTGTGSQRVTIASDNTAFPVNSTLSAETTKVIGTVRNVGNVGGVFDGATGAAVPANALYDGTRGTTALPTAVTDGQMVGAMADKYGRQVVNVGTIRDLVGTQTTTISASTTETTIVTAAASVFNDLVMLIVSNTSASTNTRIDFRDTTAGTVLFSLQSVGGAAPVGFALSTPVPQTSVNTNWTAQCATSTTDVRIYAVYAKNK